MECEKGGEPMNTKERFYSYYTQRTLISLLEKDKCLTELVIELKGNYANVFKVIAYLKKLKLITAEIGIDKVKRIVTLTDAGRKVSEHLKQATEGIEWEKKN
jgi:DNA-binding MarR family transcriptional regulator